MSAGGGQRTTCRDSVFSFYRVGPGDQTQVVSLGDTHLYLSATLLSLDQFLNLIKLLYLAGKKPETLKQ